MFNHPFNGSDFRLPVNSTDLSTIFTYRSTIAPYTYMVETNAFASHFPKALKKGYKLGATGYGDNHNVANAGSRRYGVLTSSLTKDSVVAAFKNRQTFGVLDGRAGSSYFPLAIALIVNNQLMGGTVNFNGSISYELYARDDQKLLDSLEIRYGGFDYSSDYYLAATFTNNGNEVTRTGTFSNFAYAMPKRAKFVYAVAKQKDSKNNLVEVAWSSPVFLNYNPSYVTTPTATPPQPTSPPVSTITSTPTPILTPTATPTKIITPTPTTSAITCSGGCYGSSPNCTRNCGTTCTKLSVSQTLSQCGWANARAYRCCK
ncbi:MAG: hypothetical protein WC841_02675 [Candidatus Shapirobacteria bacterium]|jgi:hypothetical protein